MQQMGKKDMLEFHLFLHCDWLFSSSPISFFPLFLSSLLLALVSFLPFSGRQHDDTQGLTCHQTRIQTKSGLEFIKCFSCSTQLSMKFFMLINLKLLAIANSFLPNIAEHENFSANKYENANYCWHFHIY